jgi:gamma-glutamyltranspeptidase/glutathione hydrolase
MARTNHWRLALRAALFATAVSLLLPPGMATSSDVALVAAADAAAESRIVEARHGIVVSVSAPASEVGLDVLKRGGNAVDAAVATAFALAVTWPEAGNIGGGGFMMVMPPGKPPQCIEYRETAPAAAKERMFEPHETALSHRAVGTPGTVRGLALAHQRHGKLPWKELVLPAVRLAEEGFALDAATAESLNDVLADKESAPFDELRRVYGKRDESGQTAAWKTGDRLMQPQLAATLRLIADGGADAFYRGKIAEQIVAEMRRGRGIITLEDLARYQAKVREPIHGTFRGYDVYGPPPPSSGGICLVQMLNILESFDLRKAGRDSPQTAHRVIEAMRRTYRDRAAYLGDSDFVEVPAHLTTKEYAQNLADGIDPDRATPSASLAGEIELAAESEHTTHFSVVDAAGMAVSNTYTLEQSFGSRVVVRGAGFLLNNEMGDFNWRPGHTDRRGRIGTKANLIAPGKRMLSSQTPTIVARDGKPVLITGSPGGRTIINTVLCVVVNVCEFEMDLPAAVDAPRLHHGWFPDRVQIEAVDDANGNGRQAKQAARQKLIESLQALGHDVRTSERQGDAHSILIRSGVYRGYADPRIAGRAAGY